jgi:hypothetical protein
MKPPMLNANRVSIVPSFCALQSLALRPIVEKTNAYPTSHVGPVNVKTATFVAVTCVCPQIPSAITIVWHVARSYVRPVSFVAILHAVCVWSLVVSAMW